MADALIFGKNMGFLLELLESDGGIRKTLFQVDDVYERYYYVPMREEAELQMWLLSDEAKKKQLYGFLCGVLSRRREKEHEICDGYDNEENPVYFCHELELRRLLRIRQESAWHPCGIVVCLDYQEEALRAYFGAQVKIQAVIAKKAAEYLRQDG